MREGRMLGKGVGVGVGGGGRGVDRGSTLSGSCSQARIDFSFAEKMFLARRPQGMLSTLSFLSDTKRNINILNESATKIIPTRVTLNLLITLSVFECQEIIPIMITYELSYKLNSN